MLQRTSNLSSKIFIFNFFRRSFNHLYHLNMLSLAVMYLSLAIPWGPPRKGGDFVQDPVEVLDFPSLRGTRSNQR